MGGVFEDLGCFEDIFRGLVLVWLLGVFGRLVYFVYGVFIIVRVVKNWFGDNFFLMRGLIGFFFLKVILF